mgnify:FL=1
MAKSHKKLYNKKNGKSSNKKGGTRKTKITNNSTLNCQEYSLTPDFCPQINVESKLGEKFGGLVLHNNVYCVAKIMKKDSHLYKVFNDGKKEKQTHLMKYHKTNDKTKTLSSIEFIPLSKAEYIKKRKAYKKDFK